MPEQYTENRLTTKSDNEICLTAEQRQRLLEKVVSDCEKSLRNNQQARQYFESRGLDPLELLKSYEFGFWDNSQYSDIDDQEKQKLEKLGFLLGSVPTFQNSLIFPVRKYKEIVNIVGQPIINGCTYTNLPSGSTGVYLPTIGLDNKKPVVLVENIIEAFSLFSAGIRNVVPLYGMNSSDPSVIRFLKSQTYPKVFIAFRNTHEGKRIAVQWREILKKEKIDSEILDLMDGMTINDMLHILEKDQTKLWFKERIAIKEIESSIREDEKYLYVSIASREYRLWGSNNNQYDSLHTHIKAYSLDSPTDFYTDSLDLYSSRGRDHLINQVSKCVGIEKNLIAADINRIIEILEERLLKKDEKKSVQVSETELQEAKEFLSQPNIVERIASLFNECGMVGNREQAALAFLGAMSRYTEKPFGVIIVSRSGAGKSYLQDMIANFTPEEDLIQLTRLTGQALFHKDENGLMYKLLTIEESEGMENALYGVRTLLSSQQLRTCFTVQDPSNGDMKSIEKVVHGNVSIMLTTTDLNRIDFETANRFLIIHLDESEQQTRQIIEYQERLSSIEGLKIRKRREQVSRLMKNIQRVLKPVDIVNNIGTGITLPVHVLNMRREISKIDSLIKTIALLNQYQRPLQEEKIYGMKNHYIEVVQSDIDTARELSKASLSHALDELSPLSRQLLEHIHELVNQKYAIEQIGNADLQRWQVAFTRKELGDSSHYSRHHLEQNIAELVETGFICNDTGRRGQRYVYRLVIDTIPQVPVIYANVETCRSCRKLQKKLQTILKVLST